MTKWLNFIQIENHFADHYAALKLVELDNFETQRKSEDAAIVTTALSTIPDPKPMKI